MNNELQHHGTLGMHWGIRRGSSSSGKRSGIGKDKAKKIIDDYNSIHGTKYKTRNAIIRKGNAVYNGKGEKLESKSEVNGKGENSVGMKGKTVKNVKPASSMTYDELKQAVSRLDFEKRYAELTRPPQTWQQKILSDAKDVTYNSLKTAAQTQLTAAINGKLSEAMGNDKKKS